MTDMAKIDAAIGEKDPGQIGRGKPITYLAKPPGWRPGGSEFVPRLPLLAITKETAMSTITEQLTPRMTNAGFIKK